MLAKRIIPCLDVDAGRVVKGIKFLSLIDAGDPVEQGIKYNLEGADELIFLDITASSDKRAIVSELVRRVADNVFIPFTVGGGLATLEDIRSILRAGADKVSLNTAAIERPHLITAGAETFGCQSIVVAIDARRRTLDKTSLSGSLLGGSLAWEVFTHGGRNATGLDAVEWAIEVERLGGGEILLTSMDQDGTQDGYDIELTHAISGAVRIPVIASGGAGRLEHFYEVLTTGGASAVLAASLFHFGQCRVHDVKQYLKAKGIIVR